MKSLYLKNKLRSLQCRRGRGGRERFSRRSVPVSVPPAGRRRRHIRKPEVDALRRRRGGKTLRQEREGQGETIIWVCIQSIKDRKYCLPVHSRDGKWLKILGGDYLTGLKKWSIIEKKISLIRSMIMIIKNVLIRSSTLRMLPVVLSVVVSDWQIHPELFRGSR